MENSRWNDAVVYTDETKIGWVAAMAEGPVALAISIGGSREDSVGHLRRVSGRPLLVPGDPHGIIEGIRRFLADPVSGLDFLWRPSGTPFQKSVWREIAGIPVGTTDDYGSIAARLGRPGAARAVAGACAANRLALAIPCHRVIRSDGSLSGYAWGTDRKRRLLELELAARGRD